MASRISDLKLGVVKISLENFCQQDEKTRKSGQYWGIGSRRKLGPDSISLEPSGSTISLEYPLQRHFFTHSTQFPDIEIL